MFLTGTRENIVGLDTTHGDLCRFDMSIKKDKKVFAMVIGCLEDLYEKALGTEGEPEILPETPQGLLQLDPTSEPEDEGGRALRRRLQELRH
jgi:hypothetical protein